MLAVVVVLICFPGGRACLGGLVACFLDWGGILDLITFGIFPVAAFVSFFCSSNPDGNILVIKRRRWLNKMTAATPTASRIKQTVTNLWKNQRFLAWELTAFLASMVWGKEGNA